MLASAAVIYIVPEFHNLDRKLKIMPSLSSATTAATAVQDASKSKLHRVKAKHNKKGQATENRNSSL